MRKNLAALDIKWAAVQKIEGQHQVTKKTALLINYVTGNQISSRRNKIHSITLELKHVINQYDVRRGVCAISLSV